jgi:hypothetical protein
MTDQVEKTTEYPKDKKEDFLEKMFFQSQKPHYISQKIKNAELNKPSKEISHFNFDFDSTSDKMDVINIHE